MGKNNACLDHVRIQEEYEKSHHVGFTNYNLKADALLRSNFISSGSLVCRNDINLNLNAQGADTSINGLCVAKKNQHQKLNSYIQFFLSYAFLFILKHFYIFVQKML